MLIEYKIRFLPDGVVVSQNIDGNPPDQDGPGGEDGPPLEGNPPDSDGPGGSASSGGGSAVQAVILGTVIIGRPSSGSAKPPKPVTLKKKR